MINRKAQRGVALIITLMMLAIITLISVIFLGLARRNRAAVSLRSSQTESRYAAEYALQRVKAELVSQIITSNQLLGFDMIVSRGQDRPPFIIPPTAPPGTVLRDPVGDFTGPLLIDTNTSAGPGGPKDSRFYLDLNRNHEFEPTLTDTNLIRIGDPEWIFILDKPDQPYGRNNRFIARYAYIAVPSGKGLDINAIHNINTNGSSLFLRNQGVGSFELNLAALFHELDPNIWTYSYTPLAATPLSSGSAFSDATNFVHYRTTVPGVNPFSLADLFPNQAGTLSSNGVDDLGDDLPAGVYFGLEGPGDLKDDIAKPYPGAEALQHYFSHQDFFDSAKTSPTFTTNLLKLLSNTPGTTNGYKFYDLLSVLGTDTGNENRGRINLNWANLGGYNLSSLTSWDSTNDKLPIVFFTNAAQRILSSMSADFFPVKNVNAIMIFPTNYYDNAMHRIMQQAANIFDAARTNEFPSVFRPIFGGFPGNPTNLYIVAWTNDNSVSTIGNYLRDNTNGIPLVIGAKKGLPNFNEYTVRSDTLISRKLLLSRPSSNAIPNLTNQVYFMGFSNSFAVEGWNSFSTRFPHPSLVEVSNTVTILITNFGGMQYSNTLVFLSNPSRTNMPPWEGRIKQPEQGFKLALMTNVVVLSNSVYSFKRNRFEPISTNQFEDIPGNQFQIPYWTVTISNRLVYLHSVGDNLIDFVILSEVTTNEISSILPDSRPLDWPGTWVWDTNRLFGGAGPTEGVRNQIDYSTKTGLTSEWKNFSDFDGDRTRAASNFLKFLLGSRETPLLMETPFNPMARLTTISTWQANDPLVHYHQGDLGAYQPRTVTKALTRNEVISASDNSSSLTNYNKAYQPWISAGTKGSSVERSEDPTITDPGVTSPDDWDFPNHRYPSVGWLGKVHRGTPWQSVYLKAGAAPFAKWTAHANNARNHPTNDYRLLDIFTTALTDNSARGLLSINQPRLAAWAAALAGIVVVTNTFDDDQVADPLKRGISRPDERYSPIVIGPASGNTNSALWIIWNAIQRKRESIGGTFNDFSQLLSIPELTTGSPFLNLSHNNQILYGLDDYAYERIPQQILGLLRVGQSRFVIYAYGQALKPEHINPSTGVVDNYQITAEYATRTVMHVEGTAQNPKAVIESYNVLPPD